MFDINRLAASHGNTGASHGNSGASHGNSGASHGNSGTSHGNSGTSQGNTITASQPPKHYYSQSATETLLLVLARKHLPRSQ